DAEGRDKRSQDGDREAAIAEQAEIDQGRGAAPLPPREPGECAGAECRRRCCGRERGPLHGDLIDRIGQPDKPDQDRQRPLQMIQSFSEALAPRSRDSAGRAVCSTVMSTTMRKTALDTIARMAHRPAREAFIGLLYFPRTLGYQTHRQAQVARVVLRPE